MIYYFLIIILSIFSFLRLTNINKNFIKMAEVVSFGLFIVIGGLRFKVGADWFMYEGLFEMTSSWSDVFAAREEKLYMSMSYILKLFYDNFYFFVFILFTVSFSLKYYIMKLYSPDIFLSLAVYLFGTFLIYDVNGLRQGMAMAFVMLSIPFILNKSFYQFILIVTVASFFHISAIAFFPFYFLAKISISNRTILISILGSIALAFPIRTLVGNSAIIQLALATDSFSHFSAYTDSDNYRVNTPILSIALFQRIFIFSLFMFYYDKIKINSDMKLLLRNGYFIAILLFLFLSFSGEIATRLSFFYKNLDIIIIPLIVYSIRNKILKISILILFVLFILIGTYRLINIPYGYLIPYNNLLFTFF